MPSLYRRDASNQQSAEITTTVRLTSHIVSTLAQAQIKSGMIAEFVSLAEEAFKTPSLQASIRPTHVKRAFETLAAQKRWGVFVQLICAVQKQPMLFATIKPAMINEAATWLLSYTEGPHDKAPNMQALRDYCEMVKAIQPHERLMAPLSAEDVEKVSSEMAKHFSHTIPAGYGRSSPSTIYYADEVKPFALLADAVKGDLRLSAGIAPAHLAKAVETLWCAGVEKINEYSTDQGYEADIPKGFSGFSALQKFVRSMDGAPETWRNSVALKVYGMIFDGFDNRIGTYVANMIKKHDWLMTIDDFSALIKERYEEGRNLSDMLYLLADCERFKPAYPESIRLWLKTEMQNSGQLSISDDILNRFGHDVITAGTEIAAELADKQDYAALSRLVSSGYMVPAARHAMMAEISKHDLYSFMMHRYDQDDPEMRTSMGECSALDIIFRKSSGDVVVCVEPESNGYMLGQRKPRHMVPATTNLRTLMATAPASNMPAIQLGFERAAAGHGNAPVWAQNLARKMLEAPAAP